MAEDLAMVGLGHRLGDMIDDYCPRCKLLLNHAIASLVEAKVAKVICQTCLTEHAFLHGRGAKKLSNPRATLFDQVLAEVSSSDDEKASKAQKKKSAAARTISRRKAKPSKHAK
jgi:hypothetical protein